jgi:hypothetical protein
MRVREPVDGKSTDIILFNDRLIQETDADVTGDKSFDGNKAANGYLTREIIEIITGRG